VNDTFHFVSLALSYHSVISLFTVRATPLSHINSSTSQKNVLLNDWLVFLRYLISCEQTRRFCIEEMGQEGGEGTRGKMHKQENELANVLRMGHRGSFVLIRDVLAMHVTTVAGRTDGQKDHNEEG
jgi:hypothetical protein